MGTEYTTRQVWKYPVEIGDFVEIEMQDGAEILCAKIQNGTLCMWALVNPEAGKAKRYIRIAGTGQEIRFPVFNDIEANVLRFIDTVFLYDGDVVLHVFEVVNYVED